MHQQVPIVKIILSKDSSTEKLKNDLFKKSTNKILVKLTSALPISCNRYYTIKLCRGLANHHKHYSENFVKRNPFFFCLIRCSQWARIKDLRPWQKTNFMLMCYVTRSKNRKWTRWQPFILIFTKQLRTFFIYLFILWFRSHFPQTVTCWFDIAVMFWKYLDYHHWMGK